MAIFKRRPQQPEKNMNFAESCLAYLHDIVYILALILLLFTFCVRIVIVSGSSMFPTLVDGDYLLLINNPLCGELEQGDIVVAAMDRFRGGEAIVKRVIATEGQTVDIDFRAGIVYVDGVALEEDYINTATHLSEGMEFPLVVDEGCVFLMGDNRGDSRDSRAPEIGLVDEREILGRAVFLVLPGTGRGEYTVERDFGRIGGLS
ncbi:MAG: signal peptidase I [Oscillospiraceae bacterium]|nr:signal peptidase I [Oscillospiraceae bacterium]